MAVGYSGDLVLTTAALGVGYSGDLVLTTLATSPAAPTSPAVSALSTSTLRVSWTDASSDESGFEVEVSSTGTGGWTLLATKSANATSHDHTGMAAGTTRHYRVRAIKPGALPSAYSSSVSGTTFGTGFALVSRYLYRRRRG